MRMLTIVEYLYRNILIKAASRTAVFICGRIKKVILYFTGGDKVIDVIDVARQADSKMKLHNYIKYFTNPDRPKVLNVISLEFSDTK